MTAPMTMTNCPADPQLLAAFVDDRLNDKERQTVIEHMATCAECRDVVMMASEFAETSSGGQVVTPPRGWVGPVITLAAAAGIAAAIFLTPITDPYKRSRRIAALHEATAKLSERPIATRPSFDFPHKPVLTPRGPGDEQSPEITLLYAASDLAELADKRPTVENLHASGVAYLLLKGQFADAAVKQLEAAVMKQTGRTNDIEGAIGAATNADLLNDLAAAYYQTGKHDDARTVITRAWQLKKSAPIAWTRAEILDTGEGWKDYLAIDKSSPWAEEARGNLDLYTGN